MFELIDFRARARAGHWRDVCDKAFRCRTRPRFLPPEALATRRCTPIICGALAERDERCPPRSGDITTCGIAARHRRVAAVADHHLWHRRAASVIARGRRDLSDLARARRDLSDLAAI